MLIEAVQDFSKEDISLRPISGLKIYLLHVLYPDQKNKKTHKFYKVKFI